ncbi:Peroxiredoxin-1 [Nibea albiflora]|uniref:Peroxiredoxin-1 n=1 Tax=Nibea albiflora TaxID=240163 RepID=A0ACB7FHQ2_NIBAL|nr:Peroxiredoxin-1 [Nibea albiflora]
MKSPLVSDTRRTISTDYGVLKEDEGIAYSRGLFIIDDKGILRQITINDLPVGRSVEETLRLVQAFQFTDKHGEDLCIKVLREDCNTSGASKVVKWMMGCFDALEKQYDNDVEVQVTLEAHQESLGAAHQEALPAHAEPGGSPRQPLPQHEALYYDDSKKRSELRV